MKNSLKKFILVCFISLLFLGAVFLYQQSKLNDGKLHVFICDVGQGDGIFIRSPKGMDILVDGGPDDSVLYCLSDNMPFWDRTIELIILTHPHEDHLTGVISVIKRYSVLSFATEKTGNEKSGAYKELVKILQEKGIKEKFVYQGDKFTSPDGVVFEIKWPSKASIVRDVSEPSNVDQNESSIVQLMTFGNFRLLLTGDAGVRVQERFMDSIGRVDVLKASHHGSKTGTNEKLLQNLNPQAAVISSGKGNRYHHPHSSTLEAFKSAGTKVFRTDTDGEIEIVSDGERWGVLTNKQILQIPNKQINPKY